MIPRKLRSELKRREKELVEEVIKELRKRSDVIITAPADEDPAQVDLFHVKREVADEDP